MARELAADVAALAPDKWEAVRDGEEIWLEPLVWLADPGDVDTLSYPVAVFDQDCHAEVCARNEWVPEYEGDEPDGGLRGREWAVIACVRRAQDCADAAWYEPPGDNISDGGKDR